jgi:hypothetical protein
MNVPRALRSVGICLALALALSACGDSDSPTAPSPNPTPAPGASTFTITGTVSQTAPTTHRRLEGAQVMLSTGTSATTNAQGVFTLSGVAPGSYLLTVSLADHDAQTIPVAVAGANLSVTVNLSPAARTIESGFDARIEPDDPGCHGSSRACDRYETGAHHSGTIEATLMWTSSDADLDIQVRCDGEVVATGVQGGDRISETVSVDVEGGRACEVLVLLNGVPQDYTIELSYPF